MSKETVNRFMSSSFFTNTLSVLYTRHTTGAIYGYPVKGDIRHYTSLGLPSLRLNRRYFIRLGFSNKRGERRRAGVTGKLEKKDKNASFWENWGYGRLAERDLAALGGGIRYTYGDLRK
jgi:hypothetical protein